MRAFSYKECLGNKKALVFVIDYADGERSLGELSDCFDNIKEALEFFQEEELEGQYCIWVHKRREFIDLLNAHSCFDDLSDEVNQRVGDWGVDRLESHRREFVKLFNQWREGFKGDWYAGERLGWYEKDMWK